MDNKWEKLTSSNEEREKIWSKNRTFAGDVWFRFRRKPTAIIGLVIILILLLAALIGPFFTKYSYSAQNLNVINIPPFMKVYEAPDGEGYMYITQALKVLKINRDGILGQQLPLLREETDRMMLIYNCGGRETALYYGQKPYVMANPKDDTILPSHKVWNRSYVLGTDNLGRDILTRLMYGTRVSLMVAFVAVAVNMVIGILFGGIAGYIGGNVDTIMMRAVDIISTIPLTLYVILIMVFMGSGLKSIVIALGSVYWVDMARLVRGQVLSLKSQDFVLAAKTIGSSAKSILLHHLIPNAMGAILVSATMLIPSAIFMEAFLSYLGIGLRPPLASLGTMCNDAAEMLKSCLYQMFLPALVICLIMFSFNFVGDALRDALDPKLRK